MFQPLISASERLWPDEFSEDCCGEADVLGEDSPDDGSPRGERSPDDLDTGVRSGAGESLVDCVDAEVPVVGEAAVGEDSPLAVLGAAVMAAPASTGLRGLGAVLGVTRSVLRGAGVAAKSWSVFRGCTNSPPVIVAAASPSAIRGRVNRFGIKIPPFPVTPKNPNLWFAHHKSSPGG